MAPVFSEPIAGGDGGVLAEVTPISPPAGVESRPVRYLLFWGEHCPHCPAVKMYLENVDLPGEHYNVDTPEGYDLAMKHDVLGTPTVILFDGKGDELARLHNIGGIRKWL